MRRVGEKKKNTEWSQILYPAANEMKTVTVKLSLVSPRRSADGVCTAGTVVVSRLKMGEMEEVDVDHIAADKPSHKVEGARQRGRGRGWSARFRCLALMRGLDWHCSSPPMRLNKLQ